MSLLSKAKKDPKLLTHPLVKSLLHKKWNEFGWLFYLDLLIYILFVVSLTAFALLLPNPQIEQCESNVGINLQTLFTISVLNIIIIINVGVTIANGVAVNNTTDLGVHPDDEAHNYCGK